MNMDDKGVEVDNRRIQFAGRPARREPTSLRTYVNRPGACTDARGPVQGRTGFRFLLASLITSTNPAGLPAGRTNAAPGPHSFHKPLHRGQIFDTCPDLTATERDAGVGLGFYTVGGGYVSELVRGPVTQDSPLM